MLKCLQTRSHTWRRGLPRTPRATLRVSSRHRASSYHNDSTNERALLHGVPPATDNLEPRLRRRVDAENAPPVFNGLPKVALADHERGPVEHLPVDIDLRPEAAQAVTIGLDLVPVERAVDDRDVDAHLSAANAELLDHDSLGIGAVLVVKAGAQRRSDLGISRDSVRLGHTTPPVRLLTEQPLGRITADEIGPYVRCLTACDQELNRILHEAGP